MATRTALQRAVRGLRAVRGSLLRGECVGWSAGVKVRTSYHTDARGYTHFGGRGDAVSNNARFIYAGFAAAGGLGVLYYANLEKVGKKINSLILN